MYLYHSGEEEKKTRNQNTAESRFYGPATSCDELGKLGYTLNGLYLVDCKDKPSKDRLEVIICRFKQPNGSKEGNGKTDFYLDLYFLFSF